MIAALSPSQAAPAPVSRRPRPAQPLRYQNIPAELQARPQWVVWRYGATAKRKIPITPATGTAADTTDPTTWGTFAEAVAAWRRSNHAGVGYVFSKDDPFAGIDLDACFDAGQLNPRAAQIVAEASSYTERSPSAQGVKLIIRAELAGAGARDQALGLEIYDHARFFTLTGDILYGAPTTIAEAQSVADAVYRACRPASAAGTAAEHVVTLPASGDAPSLMPGGALRRTDGTLRRMKPAHWLNCYLLGDTSAYDNLAAMRGWDAGDSGLRFHGFETLWYFGYPEAEIATIARALFPQNQKNRDTATWWAREIRDCLYGPKGAATRKPDIARNPTRGFVTLPPAPALERGGRPPTLTTAELLRYYHEEAGKRLLTGPRADDAAAIGVSMATLDRADRQLREQGMIRVDVLLGRAGRHVILLGAIKTPLAEACSEVLSDTTPVEATEAVATPQNDDRAPQCKGEHTGESAAPPQVCSSCPAPAAVEQVVLNALAVELVARIDEAAGCIRAQGYDLPVDETTGEIGRYEPRATRTAVAALLPDVPAEVFAEAWAYRKSWGRQADRIAAQENPQELYRELRAVRAALAHAAKPAPLPWAELPDQERQRLAGRKLGRAAGADNPPESEIRARAAALAAKQQGIAITAHERAVQSRRRNEVLQDMLRCELRQRGLDPSPPTGRAAVGKRAQAPTRSDAHNAEQQQIAECYDAFDRHTARGRANTPARPAVRLGERPQIEASPDSFSIAGMVARLRIRNAPAPAPGRVAAVGD